MIFCRLFFTFIPHNVAKSCSLHGITSIRPCVSKILLVLKGNSGKRSRSLFLHPVTLKEFFLLRLKSMFFVFSSFSGEQISIRPFLCRLVSGRLRMLWYKLLLYFSSACRISYQAIARFLLIACFQYHVATMNPLFFYGVISFVLYLAKSRVFMFVCFCWWLCFFKHKTEKLTPWIKVVQCVY